MELKDLHSKIMTDNKANPITEYIISFCRDCQNKKSCKRDCSTIPESKIILCAIAKLAERLG